MEEVEVEEERARPRPSWMIDMSLPGALLLSPELEVDRELDDLRPQRGGRRGGSSRLTDFD